MSSRRHTLIQFSRYAIVGLVSNAMLFVLYLVLTGLGLGHKLSMTACFIIGVIQTFLFNKNWTFSYGFDFGGSFLRYWAGYLSAYIINLIILFVFVDYMQLPHQAVQGVTIILLALYLFLLQKIWVFRHSSQREPSPPAANENSL
jgi:putative flippase GtrA